VVVVESVLGTWSLMSLGGMNRLLELMESVRSSRLNNCNGSRKGCTDWSYWCAGAMQGKVCLWRMVQEICDVLSRAVTTTKTLADSVTKAEV
jgi:hypothetical protein